MGMKKLCVALVAIALGAVTVAPASAAPEGNEIIEITSVASGQCLQLDRPGRYASPVLASCVEEPIQRWEKVPVGGKKYLLRNLENRQCPDESVALGAWWCDDEAATQFVQLMADRAGTVRLLFGSGFADTTRGVQVKDFADTDEQRWRVRQTGTAPVPADTAGRVVRIASVEGMGCIGVRAERQIEVTPCSDVPAQKFQRVELGNGSTALRSVLTGTCVATKLGTVQLSPDCNPAAAEQGWTFEPNKTGATRIRMSAGQRYLTPMSSGEIYISARETEYNTWQSWEVTAA
ncbi:RICIN domain-containing protein [Lentzea sp. NPDC051213]|uniref:RICIN domain-containing protein n=1 Tax=Lentzea sp. NPDC051213 TaxID=3364126 RepID=UPI0037ACB32E